MAFQILSLYIMHVHKSIHHLQSLSELKHSHSCSANSSHLACAARCESTSLCQFIRTSVDALAFTSHKQDHNEVKGAAELDRARHACELLSNPVLSPSTERSINPTQLQMLFWRLINNIPERANIDGLTGL